MSAALARRLAASRLPVSADMDLAACKHALQYPVPKTMGVGELLPHQIEHAKRLEYILRRRGSAGDTSKAGTGKMFVGSYIGSQMKIPVWVFCPKPVISTWHEVLSAFGCSIVSITNYDMARSAHSDHDVKWYDMRNGFTETATVCPWITKSKRTVKGKDEVKFTWRLPYKCFLIFDEEHMGKNVNTQTFALIDGAVRTAKAQGHYVLYASATPIERRQQLKSIMKFLGIIDTADMNRVNTFFSEQIGSLQMTDIHEYLYHFDKAHPERSTGCMSWMPEAQIPQHITNVVRAVNYPMDEETTRNIIERNREILKLKEKLHARDYQNTLGNINTNRRYIEMYKCDAIADRAAEMAKIGKWVCIFVNYKSTLYRLQEKLQKTYRVSVLHGDQTKPEESTRAAKDFNEGRTQILIATIRKGGVALSFHDTSPEGKRPRFVIASPPTSATDLVQCVRRCYRTNVTSSVLTEIPFAAGDPVEESIRNVVNEKSHDIARFTIGSDNDFDLYDVASK